MGQNQSLSAFGRTRQSDAKRAASIIRSKSTVTGVVLSMAVSLIHGGGATRPSKYDQLTPSVDPKSATSVDSFPVTLIFGRIKASHLYREDCIVYSRRGEAVGTYECQRWTEPPTEMIEEPLRGNDISAVVAALNRNGQRCVADVGTSLDEYFKSHTSK